MSPAEIHRREKLRRLEARVKHLETYCAKLELIVGLLCPNLALLAEIESIVDQLRSEGEKVAA